MRLIFLSAILLFGSFVLSVVLTAIVKKLAIKKAFVARPSSDRYHKHIIPLGGGIAMFATIAIIILGVTAAIKLFAGNLPLSWLSESAGEYIEGFSNRANQLLIVLLVVSVLFVLGLTDDRKYLSPFFKLVIQFAVAFIAASLADIRVEFFIENKIFTSILSAVWIVLIINVFNFLDNMDGASAGIAVIVSGYLFVASTLSGQVFVGGLALIFIGTLLGFLVFNFPPAKIFAGDAGSFVIGFFLAMLTLKTTYYNQAQSGRWYSVFLPLVVMAVPLYDFISVTCLRISQGKSPFVGDMQHFSHRLKRHGLSDTQTVLTLYLATLATGLGATFLYQVSSAGAILIFVQTFLILTIIAVFESTIKNDKNQN